MRYSKHPLIHLLGCCCLFIALWQTLGSCTDEAGGIDTPMPDKNIPLTIEITAEGFDGEADASPSTRYSESGNTTIFEASDIVGLFAVKNIGTPNAAIIDGINNIQLKYIPAADASTPSVWEPVDATNILYYYADVTYVAYYPYKNGITIDPTQSAADICTSFSEMAELQPAADQSTEKAYIASDLMTATGKATDTSDPNRKLLSLSFTHSYSLLVVKTNRRSTKYVAPNNAFKYHPDVIGLIADADASDMTVWGIKAFQKAAGVFHAIVKNVNGTLSGSYTTGGMLVELNQSPSGLAYLAKGKKYECTVNTPMRGTVGAKTRALQVGDFYCKDGTVWPGGADGVSEANPPDGAIGVVFWTRNPAVGYEYGFKGDPMLGTDHPLCKNGLVLYKQAMTVTRWSTSSNSIDYWIKNNNPFPGITFDITTQNVCQGYSNTKAMKKFNSLGISDLTILSTMANTEDIIGTSGWYIPSFAETSLIIHGEGKYSGTAGRDLMNKQLLKLAGNDIKDAYDTPWTSTEQIGSEQARNIMVVNYDGTSSAISKQSTKAIRIVLAF